MREFRVDGYVSDAVKPDTLRAFFRESVAAKNKRKARRDKQQGIADLTPPPKQPKVKGNGLFYLTATALQSSWQNLLKNWPGKYWLMIPQIMEGRRLVRYLREDEK